MSVIDTVSDRVQAADKAGDIVEQSRQDSVSAAFKKAKVSIDKIVRELSIIGFSDITRYVHVDDGGALQAIPLESISPRVATRAVKKVRETTKITESDDGTRIFKESKIEYELYDKPGALKQLLELGDFMPSEKQELNHRGVIIVEDPFAKYR